MNDLFNVVFG